MNPLLERGNTRLAPLDTVEPDAWRKSYPLDWAANVHTTIVTKEGLSQAVSDLFPVALYSRPKVESLLAECRKEARKEALLEAAGVCRGVKFTGYVAPENGSAAEFYNEAAIDCADELRRMAEGEK